MWQRPSGPPHVWRVIELTDADGQKRKFSIQEIPVDRYDGVVQHMCTYFVRDENICASLNLKNDKESMNELEDMWGKMLKRGIAVAAFEIVTNAKSILAGTNILFYGDDNIDEVFKIIRVSKI